MKEELQTKLVEILGSIQTAAGKAGDFAMTQLPDIAQQYVVYGRATTTIMTVLGLMVMGATFVAGKKAWNYFLKEGDDPFPVVIFGVIGFALGGMMVASNGSQALLVWLAPKVWLLKEIATLIK